MPGYKCVSCGSTMTLEARVRLCPYCGSSSLTRQDASASGPQDPPDTYGFQQGLPPMEL
jgi:rRNA maturation endonuclease Nob1